jgi:hypothetical protein
MKEVARMDLPVSDLFLDIVNFEHCSEMESREAKRVFATDFIRCETYKVQESILWLASSVLQSLQVT